MVRHCTYTDENMTISAELCRKSAMKYGCDASTIYKLEYLDEPFVEKNKDILSQKKGAGYFIWKPQVIAQEMFIAKENDYILYTDAGIEIIHDIKPLIEAMDSDIMLFGGLWKQKEWCKADYCSTLIGDERQLNAAAMIFRVSAESTHFIYNWLNTCQSPGAIDDSPSVTPNYPGFQEHRWDQAILTMWQLYFEIAPYWMPSKVNDSVNPNPYKYKGKYPVMFNHHRKRNNEW